ncbi:MAG: hypothetical protein GY751_03820 [Bacteroidetes bacterium]|nr:hypothetical protein [Bacteroidota bacterium]
MSGSRKDQELIKAYNVVFYNLKAIGEFIDSSDAHERYSYTKSALDNLAENIRIDVSGGYLLKTFKQEQELLEAYRGHGDE